MTPPVAGTIVLIIAALIGLVVRIMSVSIMAGTVAAAVLAVVIGCGIAWLRMPGKGAHAVPRGYAADEDDAGWVADIRNAVIPRPPTKHEPPWQPAPVWDDEPQTVIEPGAVTHGPPQPEPEPEAYWIAAGTVTDDGRVRLDHVAVLPPPVQKELRHATVDEALESMFTRAMALKVRALTDGAS